MKTEHKAKTFNSRYLEGIGLILIFFSVSWQILELQLSGLEYQRANERIHEKLNLIWDLQIRKINYLEKNTSVNEVPNKVVEDLINEWSPYYSDGVQERFGTAKSDVFKVRIIAFLLGSLLIIVTKFIKTNESKMIISMREDLKRLELQLKERK